MTCSRGSGEAQRKLGSPLLAQTPDLVTSSNEDEAGPPPTAPPAPLSTCAVPSHVGSSGRPQPCRLKGAPVAILAPAGARGHFGSSGRPWPFWLKRAPVFPFFVNRTGGAPFPFLKGERGAPPRPFFKRSWELTPHPRVRDQSPGGGRNSSLQKLFWLFAPRAADFFCGRHLFSQATRPAGGDRQADRLLGLMLLGFSWATAGFTVASRIAFWGAVGFCSDVRRGLSGF